MRTFLRDISILTLVALVVFVLIYLSLKNIPFFYKATDALVILPAFLLIFILVLTVSHAGSGKKADTRGFFTLSAIALKFFLPATLAVIWFEVLKNTTYADVLLFFIVYLSLSITAVLLIIRNLKNHN